MITTTLEITQTLSLTKLEDGTLRISGTRIPIETVIYHYQQGESAETIQADFPTLQLTDVHAVICHYLSHREEVEAYLAQQQRDAEEWRRIIEASPLAIDRTALRARMAARRQTLEAAKNNGHHD